MMRACFLALVMLTVAFMTRAQASLPPEIEDTQCIGINKEPAHATLMPYANVEEALSAKRHASSFCRTLKGQWKLNWVSEPSRRPVEFFKPEFDVSVWKEIHVPSNLEVLGYGTPFYRNLGYTIQRDWPRVMSEPPANFTAFHERNPVSSYRRDFEMPSEWQRRRVFITFDGVDSAFFIWVNGEKVGYSVNSRNAAEFDITRFVKPGANMVAVEVYRYSSGTWLEDQDMFRLSGIFRSVTLWSAPPVHVRDLHVRTDLDETYTDATLQVSASVRNYSDQPASARILNVTLYDSGGLLVEGATAVVEVPALEPSSEVEVHASIPVSSPAKWTAETPILYTTVLALSGESSPELLSVRTGFREIEINGRQFLVNGTPIKLKGVNRHEQWPDVGHAVTEAQMIRDLELLKQGNCNHVRTSHYSNDPRWYELCDEWGIWLLAEANCESHGYDGRFDDEPKMRAAIVDRNVANVENFKNHPSVIIWSLGNESGGRGRNYIAALDAIRQIDRDRPTHYERFGTGDGNPADIDSQMYTHPDALAGIANNPRLTKPFYLCEYAHAMFNSMGSLADYNDLFDQYPSLLGGAIWEWQDQGLWNRREAKRQFITYGGGFGEVPNDHYFIHKGVVFSERQPKPHYPEMKRAYQWIRVTPADLAAGTIRVRNQYAFLTLSGLAGAWSLTEDGRAIQRGELPELAVAPGAEQVVTLSLKPLTPVPGATYLLDVSFTLKQDQRWAKAGYEVARVQLAMPQTAIAQAPNVQEMPALQYVEAGNTISISGSGFAAMFDKTTGTFHQLSRDGKNLLIDSGGPRLHLWRAPHQNDDLWAYRQWQRYGLNELKRSVKTLVVTQPHPGEVRIECVVNAEGKLEYSVLHSAVYSIYGDGSIAVDNAVTPSGRRIPWARLGVRMQLAPQHDQVTYFGRGPMENYSDRKRGSDIGLYSASTRDLMTPYAKPMECGNHEDVRWVALSGSGLPSLMAQADDGVLQFSALPYTDEVLSRVAYSVDLPASESTVLCLASRTLGVGSNGCGPRPLDRYLVWSAPGTFSYILRLLPAGVSDFAAVGRQRVPQDRTRPAPEPPTHGSNAIRGKAIAASSYEPGEGDIHHAVDDNVDTYWHSRWTGKAAVPPHFLTLDLEREVNVAAVKYVRRGDLDHGHIRDYELYLSKDGDNWGEAVVKGALDPDLDLVRIPLPQPVQARYMKLVILSEQRNRAFATVAELSVEESPERQP